MRGLLLGVFFFSVGMHMTWRFIWREPLLVPGGFLAMMVIKSVLLVPLCRAFGIPLGASVETGLLLARAASSPSSASGSPCRWGRRR